VGQEDIPAAEVTPHCLIASMVCVKIWGLTKGACLVVFWHSPGQGWSVSWEPFTPGQHVHLNGPAEGLAHVRGAAAGCCPLPSSLLAAGLPAAWTCI